MCALQMLSKDQLLGMYGALLSRMVHLRAFITFPQQLQASALLALTQLMAADGAVCADNVAVLFTLLHKRYVCLSHAASGTPSWSNIASTCCGSYVLMLTCQCRSQ